MNMTRREGRRSEEGTGDSGQQSGVRRRGGGRGGGMRWLEEEGRNRERGTVRIIRTVIVTL